MVKTKRPVGRPRRALKRSKTGTSLRGRRKNAILQKTPIAPEGMEYSVSSTIEGERFEMRTNYSAFALIAAQAIEDELGVPTNVMLGNTVVVRHDNSSG